MKQRNLPKLLYSWGLCGCLAFAAIIALVSLQSGHTFRDIVLVGGVSFFIMYLLLEMSFSLFSKFNGNQTYDNANNDYSLGAHIDVSLNDGDQDGSLQTSPTTYQKVSALEDARPGQVQSTLSPESELGQQIKQRMGLDN